MPKIEYYNAIFATCIGYMLGHDVFWTLIIALMSISLWNFIADLPRSFGYVRKDKYLKLNKKYEKLKTAYNTNQSQLHDFAAHINRTKDYILSDEEKQRIKNKATIDGQNAVFYVYLNDKIKFNYHLQEYIRVKVNPNNRPKPAPAKPDWRAVLNVSSTATEFEVNKAWKDLVKQYHPDRNKDPDAKDKMLKINEAKELADKYFENA